MDLVVCLFFDPRARFALRGFSFLARMHSPAWRELLPCEAGLAECGVMSSRAVVGILLYDLIVAAGMFPRTFGLVC